MVVNADPGAAVGVIENPVGVCVPCTTDTAGEGRSGRRASFSWPERAERNRNAVKKIASMRIEMLENTAAAFQQDD
jgi:hypothetical protein